MSFGFGGFGQNNQSSGFGAGSGFGASTSGGGFGSTSSPFGGGGGATTGAGTSGGSLFGNTSSSFGSGGFGTQNQSNPLFGGQNRPASSGFGSPATSTGGGLFGGGSTGAATTGGSGFGGFGSGGTGGAGGAGGFGSSGGGLFGSKPAATGGFGAGTGGFGSTGAAPAAGGFGAGTGAPAAGAAGFGSGTGTAFQQQLPPSDGTASTPFSPFTEKDNSSNVTNHYQSISFMQPYNKYSFEELRLGDYNQGRRYGNGSGQAGAFGSSAFGAGGGTGFGAAAQPAAGGFGSAASTTPFGGAGTSAAPSGFGSTPTAGTGGFGSTGSNPLFGASKPATSLFGGGGATGAATSQPGGSLFGGGSGTATTGGFGSSTGTGTGGGFGSGGGSLFGSNNNQQQQNKPLFGGGAGATGGTGTGFGGFGGTQTSSAAGPFGGTAATTTPFGQNQQTGTGGGAFGGFGQNQNQTQNKGLFGGGGGFGAGAQQQQQQPAAGSSLFGGGAGAGTGGSSLFGGQNQQQQPQQQGTGSSLFGGGATQQPAAGGSSLFGGGAQQQQKPGGLFGSGTPTAGTGSSPFGGFGQNQGQAATGGSSLFGGGGAGAAAQPQQQKPSLFGGGTGGGSSLFGGGQSTAAPGGGGGSSLFGGSQTQQPQMGGGLGGSSLFGNSQASQQPQQPQQPAPGSLQASLLDGNPYGNQSIFSGLPAPSAPSPGPLATPLSSSMKQKQRTPLPVHKITPSASTRLVTPPKRGYGFSYSTYGSPSSTTSTPNGSGLLGGGGGSLRGSLSGLGGAAGAGGSFNRSFSKSFSTSNLRKSFDPDTDSVLSPGALTSGSSRLSSGGLKRLTIDRSLRNDLFARPASTSAAPPPITNGEDSAPPAIERAKKRVSFDSAAQSTGPDGSGGELVAPISESPEPTPEELGFLRTIRRSGSVNGLSSKTSFDSLSEQRSGSRELASVPEDAEAATPAAAFGGIGATSNGVSKLPFNPPGTDPQPGEYWMKPSRAEINKMSRDQQKSFKGLTVGRQHCGQVTFEEPVDLTTIDLDQIFGGLVEIMVRKITVYPDEAIKPPMGKGLNVVSVLRIENSWPRGRDKKSPTALTSGPLFDKHIDRLKKVVNAEFIDYETASGTWVFRVPHFTTYGLDYDDDEEEEAAAAAGEKRLDQSTMSAVPDNTPTPKAQRNVNFDDFEPTSTFSTEEDSFVGSIAGVDDDTFDFKKRKMVPGAFGDQGMMDMDEQRFPGSANNNRNNINDDDEESFLGESSTGSTTEQDIEEDVDVDEDDATVTESQHSGTSEVGLDEDAAMDMAGAFPTTLHHTVERNASPSTVNSYVGGGGGGAGSPQRPTLKPWGTPAKARLDLSGDWAEQLQRTISPRKQNRDALREIQGNAFHDRPLQESPSKKSPAAAAGGNQSKKSFTNSIDLMNSLFQQQPRKQQAQKQPSSGFEWPYQKQTKSFAGESNELSRDDIAFHHSFKPRWGPMDSVVTIKNDMKDARDGDNGRWEQGITISSEDRDIIVLGYNKGPEVLTPCLPTQMQRLIKQAGEMLEAQKRQSVISRVDGVPFARLAQADFRQFTQISSASAQAHSDNELLVWQLANVLFNDDLEDDISASVPVQLRQQYASRIKKDRLGRLWEGIVRQKYVYDLERANSDEERAVYLLCSHRLEDACKTLLASRDFRLATLVAQIGRDPTIRNDMAQQIDMWRQHNVFSEMTEPIRAIYELLAGNALRSEGKAGGALEDRASTFTFTERFELDWFQAFGLRLWYAIADDEPLEAAVAKFVDDLARGETAYPSPTSSGQDRESPLWVLIKMYAATSGSSQESVEFPAALLPESVSGDRLSNRLSFQLYQLLATAVGHEANDNGFFQINSAQADKLTWDYAWELSVTNTQLANALFVLLHLSRPADRERAIKDTLARFAPQLPDPVTSDGSPDPTWHSLSTYLQIPESWIWVAKALCARDAGDAAREVDCLIRGKNWNDAHATFVRTVGPTAVIERDYATLETLVSGFGDSPERKVRGWARGGGLYEDFLRLATAKGGRRDSVRLNRLVNALGALGESETVRGSSVEGLEERVAFKEMSRAVAGWSASEEAVELSSVLGLPLTGDARLLQTAEMSRRYYGIIMAGAY